MFLPIRFGNSGCKGKDMARISKADQARILHLVDVEHRKVTEVAAEYGCTPANIYTLLGKLRRANSAVATPNEDSPDASGVMTEGSEPPVSDRSAPSGDDKPGLDLFLVPELLPPQPAPSAAEVAELPHEAADHDQEAPDTGRLPEASRPQEVPPPASTPAEPQQPETVANFVGFARREAAPKRAGGVGARLAKPGFCLAMRTVEGDEDLTPFGSLEDLLSAIKPILRSAARSPDPIWFSIQPIDLSTLDSEAA
jgi:hypothetical protein